MARPCFITRWRSLEGVQGWRAGEKKKGWLWEESTSDDPHLVCPEASCDWCCCARQPRFIQKEPKNARHSSTVGSDVARIPSSEVVQKVPAYQKSCLISFVLSLGFISTSKALLRLRQYHLQEREKKKGGRKTVPRFKCLVLSSRVCDRQVPISRVSLISQIVVRKQFFGHCHSK